MNTNANIVVAGTGHNSLITPAYLATAGKKVLALERAPNHGTDAGRSGFEPAGVLIRLT